MQPLYCRPTQSSVWQLFRQLSFRWHYFHPPAHRETWQIYADIVSIGQQLHEDTTEFIQHKRYLFNEMKSTPYENHQVAIILSLLRPQVRACIMSLERKIKTYTKLLALVQEAKHNIALAVSLELLRHDNPDQRHGNEDEEPIMMSVQLPEITPQAANGDWYAMQSKRQHYMPVADFSIFGEHHHAIFDSSSRISVPSEKLTDALLRSDSICRKRVMKLFTADNKHFWTSCLITDCLILINRRPYKITFTIIPNINVCATMIGADFLECSGVLIDFADQCWYFERHATERYSFVHDRFVGGCAESYRLSRVLRTLEGDSTSEEHKRRLPEGACVEECNDDEQSSVDRHTGSHAANEPVCCEQSSSDQVAATGGMAQEFAIQMPTQKPGIADIQPDLTKPVDVQPYCWRKVGKRGKHVSVPPERDKDCTADSSIIPWPEPLADSQFAFEEEPPDRLERCNEQEACSIQTAWQDITRTDDGDNYHPTAATTSNPAALVTKWSCAQHLNDDDVAAHGQKDEWAELYQLNERPAHSTIHPNTPHTIAHVHAPSTANPNRKILKKANAIDLACSEDNADADEDYESISLFRLNGW